MEGEAIQFDAFCETLKAEQREKLTDEQNKVINDLLDNLSEQVKFHVRGTQNYDKYIEWKLEHIGSHAQAITPEEKKKLQEKVLKYCTDFKNLSNHEIELCWKSAREKLINLLSDPSAQGQTYRENFRGNVKKMCLKEQ